MVMKRRTHKFQWSACFGLTVVAFMVAALVLSGPVMAADNIGTGDIAGDSDALNSSNTFQLFTTTMSLNKMAFLPNGTRLVSGATLPRGTEVRFMIYIDNTTAVPINDVSIQDVLDPVFAYQAGSMQVDNSAANAATPGEIYAAVNAGTAVLDPIGADVASAIGVTIDVGDQNAANGTLNIAANRVWAILFRTLMQ
jgi:uncharacterized repeat protein (TIGR01451 family)